ncbi:TauD/TfdA family dioxygenase [Streptomyces sp. NPDC051364]|uniref:TauD/TfdA dioxygenase family protein n=1 Tax=Streptomyces sp. NPDC051364 TaxID=3155799 RepID=UPI003432B534
MPETLRPKQHALALVRPQALRTSLTVEPLTCSIGAELSGVSLADAARDDDLFAEIKILLLEYKVLFLRDQDITRADHVAFAERFGPLEDHPVAGSDPEHPGAWSASTRPVRPRNSSP